MEKSIVICGCKDKWKFRDMQPEFWRYDPDVLDKAIEYAKEQHEEALKYVAVTTIYDETIWHVGSLYHKDLVNPFPVSNEMDKLARMMEKDIKDYLYNANKRVMQLLSDGD